MPKRVLLPFLLGSGLLLATLSGTVPAAAATQLCDTFAYTFVSGDAFVVQNQRWGADTPQCVDAVDGGFTITSEDHDNPPTGQPAAYPSIFAGCHWARCTAGSGLPIRMDDPRARTVTTGVDVTIPDGSEIYNASFDIWLDPTPRTDGQQTGAEMMVWLERRGGVQPVGQPVATAHIADADWTVWYGVSGWPVISYVRATPVRSIDYRFADFYDDAVARGYADPAWYLTNIEAGFEVWRHVQGMAVDEFRYHIEPPESTTTTTTTPPAACRAEYRTVSFWPGGYQGSIVLTNTSGAAWRDWRLGLTLGAGQRITQSWSGTAQQTGTSASIANAAWNGQVPAGRSVEIGFLATGPGVPSANGFTLGGAACG
jgi:hypothetical protein